MRQSGGRESEIISEAMAALARRSHQARRKRLGKAAYREAMRELGLRGGEAARGKSGRKPVTPEESRPQR